MNIDRPMVSLFFEIKRNLPATDRDEMRIAAPDVGERLVAIYQDSNNSALKELIETFMDHAGSEWTKQLTKPKKSRMLFLRN